MRFRLAMAFALFSLGAFGQQSMTVDKLIEFMRSSIPMVKQKQITDTKLAESLKNIRLSEKLEDRVIEELQEEGLPPRTVAALKVLAASSANKPVAEVKKIEPPAPPPEEPPPPPAKQKEVLEAARQY